MDLTRAGAACQASASGRQLWWGPAPVAQVGLGTRGAPLKRAGLPRSSRPDPCRQRAPGRGRRGGRSLLVRAEGEAPAAPRAKPPKEVTQPRELPDMAPAQFGFVDNAERLNSRAAMIGWVALLLVEGITHKGLLELVGLRVGQGLGFEF